MRAPTTTSDRTPTTRPKVRALRVQTDLIDGWLQKIVVDGELDAYTAPRLMEVVTDALDAGHAWLVIDLRGVKYIDSVGLGILIGGAKRAGERNGDLAVACDRPGVCRVFEVSGTAELLNVMADLPAAIEALAVERAARTGADDAAEGDER